ncbi:MAG: hypothetical protein IJH50_03325, partial [Kiritimatiellae bacterium]|nr:hypothetical protein [Kiritimatiellia bacterium]
MAKTGCGREARPVERVDSARCALAARDSRHCPKRIAVLAALRSLITSPGRSPALRLAPHATMRGKPVRRAGRSGRARTTNANEREDVMAKHMTLDTR